jgi:hypothetical protein
MRCLPVDTVFRRVNRVDFRLVAAALCLAGVVNTAAAAQPNIVLITADDQN